MAAQDPGDFTVSELRDELEDVTDPDTLETMLEAERDGKDRKTAKEAIEGRRDEVEEESGGPLDVDVDDVEATTEEIRETIREELDSVNDSIVDALTGFLKTPQRASVYVQTVGEGVRKADIPGETGLNEDRVDEIIEDLRDEGLVQHTGGGVYRAAKPRDALRNFRDRLNELIESETEERVGGRKEFSPDWLPYRVIFESKDDESAD